MDIYVHIPFCTAICPFCPYLKIAYDDELADRYLQALGNELTKLQINSVGSIYIGGGTPSLTRNVFPLLGKIKRSAEFAAEILPNHLDDNLADFLSGCGVNYISLGIQSMNERVLHHLQRPNTPSDNELSLNIAVNNFECVDVDLIFDVVNFDTNIALSDFRYCLDSRVSQISTYPLMRFGFTPFGRVEHNRKLEHQVLRRMEKMAEDAGYHRNSVWTFTRGGNRYSSITRRRYLGIGASAASFTGNFFWVNTFNVERYIERLRDGKSAVEVYTPMKGYRKFLYEKFWQLYNGRLESIPWLMRCLLLTGHLKKNDSHFVLTRRGYEAYHDIERWVTYNYIEPLWEMMYSMSLSSPVKSE